MWYLHRYQMLDGTGRLYMPDASQNPCRYIFNTALIGIACLEIQIVLVAFNSLRKDFHFSKKRIGNESSQWRSVHVSCTIIFAVVIMEPMNLNRSKNLLITERISSLNTCGFHSNHWKLKLIGGIPLESECFNMIVWIEAKIRETFFQVRWHLL